MLEAKGLATVEDLLAYAPFRYEDRTNIKTIAQLAPGEMATVVADVQSAHLRGFRRRNIGLFEAIFKDASKERLLTKWFHGGYLVDRFLPGVRAALYGKIELDNYTGDLLMMHPEFEILGGDDSDGDAALHTGRIVPIYEAAGKVTTRAFRGLVHRVLESIAPLEDNLPAALCERLKLPDRWTATRALHFPSAGTDLRLLNNYRTPAQWRLIFEEFFWLECGLSLKRAKARLQPGISFELNERVREKIKTMLPFKPTGAQFRVLKEIAEDMKAPHPMSRLLQGDVGSGKTLVAAEAAVIAIENGYQAAVLAPTEILASQHYFYFKNLFQKMGYVPALLTGSNTQREKSQLKKLLAEGLIHVGIGTHALIEEDVEWKNLGLAIVDEQHRFGVMQRMRLVSKAKHPDVLVMTATPIPRTLALTIYGDLDISIIDELPPGPPADRDPERHRRSRGERVQLHEAADRWRTSGLRCLSGDRRVGGDEGRATNVRASLGESFSGHSRRAVAREVEERGEGKGDGSISPRRSEDPGGDHGDRGGRRCSQRYCHGDRTGRTLWTGAIASTPRARGAGSGTELLHSGDRKAGRFRARAHPHHGGF